MTFSVSPSAADVTRRTLLRVLAAAAATAVLPNDRVFANEPIRIVIAFPPGGTSTALVKPLEQPLQAALGAAIERDYKPGAGGNVAALQVVQAKPDGHTLLVGHAGPLAINHHILVQSAFDPQKDLAPVAMLVEFPIIIGVASRHGVASVKDLIALAKTKRLIVGSSGNGSIQHLAAEVFCRETGIETVHIPFAGGGPLQQAFERGAVDLMLETGSNLVKHMRESTLKPIAVMGRERLPIAPDVPTVSQIGLKELDVAAWFGLLAPSNTPKEVVQRTAQATLDALNTTDVRQAYEAIGGVAKPLGPEAFANYIATENKRWATLIQQSGLSPIGTGSTGTIGTPQ